MKLFILSLLFSGIASAADWTAPPYPAQTTDPNIIVNAAGTVVNGGILDLQVNGVWYRGHTEYTLIGIPSQFHKVFQSSVTVLQAENGAHLTTTVEMVMQGKGEGRYISWTYTIVSGTVSLQP